MGSYTNIMDSFTDTQNQMSETKQNLPSKAHTLHISNMKNVDFKLHIAVDFGTDGCALAFVYKDKVTIYDKWNAACRGRRKTKTKTQLILNENNEVTVFGNAANFVYFNLS
eukprot:330755_1